MNRARLLALLTVVAASGCLGEGPYEERISRYLEDKQMEGKRNNLLDSATQNLDAVDLEFRLPKNVAPTPQPFLAVPQGSFDLAQAYAGISGSDATAEGVPLQLLVLGRLKKPKPPAEGQPAPPPPGPRNAFLEEVRAIVGLPEAPKPVDEAHGGVAFKRFDVRRPNPNAPDQILSTLQVYLFDQGNHEVALLFDVPSAMANSPLATEALPVSLSTLKVKAAQ
jgi:hypothetical protein